MNGNTAVTAIRVTGLRKRYGQLEALRGVDFEVAAGECFALLGPNGAGKTTTVEILEGYREPTAGTVEVLGLDPQRGGPAFRERIGIVLQQAGLDQELTVEETLRFYAGLYPRPRAVGEVIELVGLDDKRKARLKTLSGGQRRRLDLALGLIGDPHLLFLDEPTTGFDPSARRRSWDLIGNLRSLGKTILLTTHYMDEAQHLADRVAVIVDGRIVAEGPPESIGGREAGDAVISFRLPDGATLADLPADLPEPIVDDGVVSLRTPEPTGMLHTLTGWAVARGAELPALTVARPTLEDVYLQLAGEQARSAGPSGAEARQ